MTPIGAEPDSLNAKRDTTKASRWVCRIFAIVLLMLGLALSIGGIILVADAGSAYYLITGLAFITSAVLLWRGDARGIWVYAAMLVWTTAWSLWEVGFNGWQLAPRLIGPFVLGAVLLLPHFTRLKPAPSTRKLPRGWPSFAGGLVAAIALGSVSHAFGPDAPDFPMLRRGVQSQAPAKLPQPLANNERTDWQAYGNDQGGTRFSPLADIDTTNVSKLVKVWEADMAPVNGDLNAIEGTPIMMGSSLYACDGNNGIHAFDAETGKELWRRDISNGVPQSGKPCRGVAYYKVPDANGFCSERIYAPSHNPTLVALDAKTGEYCPGFGNNGAVDLTKGVAPYPHGLFYVSSAPQVIRGKIVVGGGIPDGQ